MIRRSKEAFNYFGNLNSGYLLLLAVFSLTLLGLVVLSSAEQSFGGQFSKQLVWFAMAIAACVFTSVLDLEALRKHTWWIFGAVMLLLVLVLVPSIGVKVNGARRWLDIGITRMQVSDLARPMLILVLAHYISNNQRHIKTFWRGFAIPCMILGSVCALILVEPDFGTAFLCGALGFILLYLAGVKLLYWIPTVFSGCVLFAIAIYLDPIRLERITSFLNVEANKLGSTYQLWQSILAFGAGGLEGVGLGQGRQQLSYLPEATTDFIFPVIAEELGFFFTSGVVIFFFIIFACGIYNLKKAPNMYQFIVATGALLFISLQSIINMGVVTGLLPTKGMSLPFISYGGSNLIIMFVLVGLIINCFSHWAAPPLRKTRDL